MSSRLRIQFVLPFLGLTGGCKTVIDYANRLAKRGHHTSLLFGQADIPWWKPRGYLKTLLRDQGILPWVDWYKIEVPVFRVPDLCGPKLPEADIVVATNYFWAGHVHRMPESAGRKFYLIQAYETDWIENKALAESSYQYPMRHIVNASWIGRILHEKFGSSSIKVVNAFDYSNYAYRPHRNFRSPARCLMLYHDLPAKGTQDGLKAFEIAARQVPGLTLTLFGVRSTGLQSPHQVAGAVPEDKMSDLYHDHDIFIWPSIREGLGAPPMEAMVCQCAVATTDNGGSEEFAFHEKTALVSPPADPDALAKNIVRLAADLELRKRLARESCAWVRENITWEKACEGMERAFTAPPSLWTGPNVSPYGKMSDQLPNSA